MSAKTFSHPADDDGFEYLETAIRIYPTIDPDPAADGEQSKPTRKRRTSRPNQTIVFDCETTTDTTQRLLFGSWRIYIDDHDADPASSCMEEGIFYADDLPERDPDGYRALCDYVDSYDADVKPGSTRRLVLMSRTEFVEQVIFKRGHRYRARIVGFNLPFDLSRLAVHAGVGRRQFTGSVSLRLATYKGGNNQYRPWIAIKPIGSRRSLIQFTRTSDKSTDFRGDFVDVASLTFAHSNERDSLERACERFGVPYRKRDVTHGRITADYISYCREDVAATAALYQAVEIEHRRHPISTTSNRVHSPAAIPRGYWKDTGITPFAEREFPFDPTIAGYAMAAFFGGRAECRIRHVDVPVVSVDFLSMYMTCNVLMDTWSHITATQSRAVDATREVQRLLARDDLAERCFDPALWKSLHTLVKVDPNGATLPVRAKYNDRTWGMGINPLRSPSPRWYPLADIIAAVVLGGPAPIVLEAIRLVPSDDKLHPLRNIALRGQVQINPKTDDFFKSVVEERHRVRNSTDLDEEERGLLDRFLKVFANSSGYGTLLQFNRQHTRHPVDVTVHTDNKSISFKTTVIEEPAEYTHPVLASCLTAAARLMLALLEREVTSRGGTYAMCDTDSMAIVATQTGGVLDLGDDTITALDWATVDAIVQRFTDLNPYDQSVVSGSILEYEKYNFDHAGQQREIHCYAISAKRYQLTTADGTSLKASGSGLGHLINPITGDDTTDWIAEAWNWIRNPDGPEPEWLDQPALSSFTVTGPDALRWFKTINADLDYPDQIKPYNFIALAHPDPLSPSDAQPISPHHRSPDGWTDWLWIDRTTGEPVNVHTHPRDGYLRDGVRILTIRDVLERYRLNPEYKSTDANGQTCQSTTRGLLHRRPVIAIPPVELIGKEAHNLERRAHGIENPNDTLRFNTATFWTRAQRVLATIPTSEIAADTGIHQRTIQRAIAGSSTPRKRNLAALYDYAANTAQRATGRNNHMVAFHIYLRHAETLLNRDSGQP